VSWRAVADLLSGRLTPEAAGWFRGAQVQTDQTDDGLRVRWSGAGRRLGKAALSLAPAEVAALRAAGAPFIPQGWGTDECGRAVLLVAALEGRAPERQQALVEELYRTGELRERQALLRVLPALAEPARYASLGAEAVRTNALPEIEALACDNPYPAAHFPEEAFNQMVLKCLFNGIPLARIVGLPARRTPELRRMVAAYAAERRAAGRPIPADAALVLEGGPDAPV
jgi:hypothetical protein